MKNKKNKPTTLSPELEKQISDNENSSEILITCLQLGFVCMMSILYFISPKGFNDISVIFRPVPIMLGAWIIVLIVRFILSVKRLMRGFIVYVSIIIDVALLIGLIWSFHLQYNASPGLSLKAPTFIFLLFFLSLRALRYKVRYIIAVCIAAIVGWVVLVMYAIRTGTITNSFLTYTTSDTVLVGAEVEKLIGLVSCAAILSFAIYKSRKLLIFSYQQRTTVQSLSHFFNPEVVKRISGKENVLKAGTGEERCGVIMSVDIRKFTQFSATNTPETVMTALSEYQALLIPIFFRNGGSVDKFLGDGILVHFGIVDDQNNYAANALRTAEEIIEDLQQWNEKRIKRSLPAFEIGIGMEEGVVIFGTVGNEKRLEFTAIGNPVNVAVKLEKATKKYPTSILCTPHCYQVAVRQDYKPTFSPYRIKDQKVEGIAQTMDVVGLLTDEQRQSLQNSAASPQSMS